MGVYWVANRARAEDRKRRELRFLWMAVRRRETSAESPAAAAPVKPLRDITKDQPTIILWTERD